MQTNTTKTPVGLKLSSLTFSKNSSWHDTAPDKFTARANFQGDGPTKEFNITLDESAATEIMKLLMPIMTAAASREAQKLADQTKNLANDISTSILTAIENK